MRRFISECRREINTYVVLEERVKNNRVLITMPVLHKCRAILNPPPPPPPASHLPARLLGLRQRSQKKSVGPLTTGTVMCNYSVTPGCPSPVPPPPPQCVSVAPVPMTYAHTHTHTHIHTHASLGTLAQSHSGVVRIPVGGSQVVRIRQACWEKDTEPDFPVDLCQQGFPPPLNEVRGILCTLET